MKFWTKSLLSLCAVSMVVCAVFLYHELTEKIDKIGGEVIGTITFKKKSASRRYSENVIWEEIETESEIFNYDAIRTMEYSSAVLSLKDGTRIELDQNTLLVVILSDKGLNINFDRGGVSAASGTSAGGPITLNSKDATIALDKGAIAVSSSDAGMDIHVNSGSARIAAEGKELNISPDESATLKNGIVESRKNSLFPELPAHNSNFVTFGGRHTINFSWRSESRGEVKFEIAHDSGFKSIAKSGRSSKSVFNADLPAGDYYWRLTEGNAVSTPWKFSILADVKPELIAPYANQKVSLTEGAEIVTFRWEKSKYASLYELTAARDKNMTDKILSLTSKTNIISSPAILPGQYYWIVKSVYSPGITADQAISQRGYFEVEKIKFSDLKPVPLDRGPVTTAGSFTLHWKGLQGSKKYTVDISHDESFKSIITTKSTVETFVLIDKKIAEGKYFWRVSALSAAEKPAISSSAVLTLIRPVQLVILNPPDGAVISGKPLKVNFSWRDPNSGGKYLLEVSDRKDFRNMIYRIETSAPAADLKIPGEGSYFWRVLLKDSEGKIITQSAKSEFMIPGYLKVPVLIYPGDKEKIIPGMKKRLLFEWGKSAGANEYEIEIFSRVSGGEKPLMIYSSKTNFIELSNQSVFRPGTYTWIVRAKDMRNGRLTAFRESEKFSFEVEEVVLLPAPVVNNPGIIFK